MVSAVTSPITDYLNVTANKANLMASFQKTPDYKNAVANYQAQIGKITNVDQFLGNYKVLQFALQAYGLESAISETGFLKKLLTEDPTQSSSLAQTAGDPRLIAFAKAYWGLSGSNPSTVSSPASVNAVTARYTNVQFGQWASDMYQDPALATALSAQQTLQDAVDVTNVGTLFAQYQKSPAVQDATSYYQAHIKSVTSPADLEADPKLLDVALTAYGIDPASISSATVDQLLTQNPTDANSVAFNNPAYGAFAAAFATLKSDGGAGAASASSISDVTTKYQTASFQKALASNDEATNERLFGPAGAKQIAALQADFASESGVTQSASYFTSHVTSNMSVADFVNDAGLLDTALIAYGLSPTSVSASTAQLLLTQDPTDPNSLAAQSPSEMAFVNAVKPLFSGQGGGFAAGAASAIAAQFQQTELEAAIGADLTQAQSQASNDASAGAPAGAPLSDYQIIADSTLATVVYGAYGQPASLGALDPDQQVQALTRAGFDPADLTQPDAVTKLVEKYLVNAGQQNGSGSSDPLLTLFGAQDSSDDGSGLVTLDTSALFGGGSSGGVLI